MLTKRKISICVKDNWVDELTATDGSSAGLEQVDVVLFLQGLDLLGGQTGVGEHSVLSRVSDFVSHTER